jgi:formylglycine-generating enzyme required for sulfatase activity
MGPGTAVRPIFLGAFRSLAVALVAFAGCTDACPLGYEAELDQCVQRAAPAPEHRCSALPAAKDDPGGPGTLARVDVPQGDCFWMAQNEVTVDEYQGWVDQVANDDIQWEGTWCQWKRERSNPVGDPLDACANTIPALDAQPFAPRSPIRCVDFCDAEAFCRYANKRLCYGGGSSGVQGPRRVPREWTLGCTNGLTTVYPWGDTSEQNDCNVSPAESDCVECSPFVVGRQRECVSPNGITDLIGNVAEWGYSCTFIVPGEEQHPTSCNVRGGGFTEPLQTCYAETSVVNDSRRIDLGFRCCADLTDDETRALSVSSP